MGLNSWGGQGQAVGTGQVYTTACEPQPPTPGALESIDRDLDQIVERIGKVNGRINHLANRLFGSHPEAVGKAEGRPDNPAAVGHLHDKVTKLVAYVTFAENELERLEAL